MEKIKLAFKDYKLKYLNFFHFILHPKAINSDDLSVFKKAKKTLAILDIKFFLAITAAILVGVFYDPENITKARMRDMYSTQMLLLLGGFILPLLEEAAFRLWLKFKPVYLAISLGLIGYYIVTKAVFHTRNSDIENHFMARVLTFFAIAIVTYSFFSFSEIKKWAEKFWKDNFRGIYYVSAIVFAWVHILNYELTLKHLLLLPLLTLPQLVAGFCYGYIRINYGFLYSLGLHMFWNTFSISMSLIPGFEND